MQVKEVPTSTAAAADGLAELGVAAAAAAIRNGDISSESYTSALLQRAQMYSDLNTFITIDEAAALAAARAADKSRAAGSTAPLLGVPSAIKDSYLTRGLRTGRSRSRSGRSGRWCGRRAGTVSGGCGSAAKRSG